MRLISDVFVAGKNRNVPVGGFDSSGGSLYLCRKAIDSLSGFTVMHQNGELEMYIKTHFLDGR